MQVAAMNPKYNTVEDIPEDVLNKEKEILMVYTCYPLKNYGHAYERYVVYANLINTI